MEGFQAWGGLGLPRWWYITETVIYHPSKLTRHGSAGPAFRRRHEAAAPAYWPVRACDLQKRRGRSAGTGARAGPDPGSRSPTLDHQGSTVASRCRPPVPAPQPPPCNRPR